MEESYHGMKGCCTRPGGQARARAAGAADVVVFPIRKTGQLFGVVGHTLCQRLLQFGHIGFRTIERIAQTFAIYQ